MNSNSNVNVINAYSLPLSDRLEGYSLKANERVFIGGRVFYGRYNNVHLSLVGGTVVRAYVPIEGLIIEAPIGEVELYERLHPYDDWHRVPPHVLRAAIEHAESQHDSPA